MIGGGAICRRCRETRRAQSRAQQVEVVTDTRIYAVFFVLVVSVTPWTQPFRHKISPSSDSSNVNIQESSQQPSHCFGPKLDGQPYLSVIRSRIYPWSPASVG